MTAPAPPERTGRYVAWAVLAAALYALSAPVAKLLLDQVAPAVLAALLYLGAGTGMGAVALLRAARRRLCAAQETGPGDTDPPLEHEDLPYVLLMVGLDVVAPLLLMLGLARAQATNVALLNSFEIVSTTVIALLLFGEHQGRRLWAGISVITAACALLVLEDPGALLRTEAPGTSFLLPLGLMAVGTWLALPPRERKDSEGSPSRLCEG